MIRIRHSVCMQLYKKTLSLFLSALIVLSVMLPAAPLVSSAAPGKVEFIFKNWNNAPVKGVTVTLTPVPEDAPEEPDPEEPNPEEPKPNPEPTYSATSNAAGIAKFDDVAPGTYTYAIMAGNEYDSVPDGQIVVSDSQQISLDIKLYAAKPTEARIELEGVPQYGETVTLKVVGVDWPDITYSWFHMGNPQSCTSDKFVISALDREDAGYYECHIESDVWNSYYLLGYDLEVYKAIPEIQISVRPESGNSYSDTGFVIDAELKHRTNANMPAPTGSVIFAVEDQMWTAELNNGIASSENIHLKSGNYTITATYKPAEEETIYAETSTEVEYTILQNVPERNKDYTVNDPTGSNNWYNSNGPLVITPIGAYDGIICSIDDEPQESLEIEQETTAWGAEVSFYLVDSRTGEISKPASEKYMMDTVAPKGLSVSERGIFGGVAVTLSALDNGSGVDKYIYYDNNGAHEVEAGIHGQSEFWVSNDRYRLLQYFVAVDKAGNISSQYRIVPRTLLVAFSPATRIVTPEGIDITGQEEFPADSMFFHTAVSDRPVSITLTAMSRDADQQKISISINDNLLDDLTWQEIDNSDTAYSTVTLPEEDGEYVIEVKADGYLIACSDKNSENYGNPNYLVTSKHIIDTSDPKLNVSYDPAVLPSGEVSAFANSRTAHLTVEEEYFTPANVKIVDFSATDVTGAPLENAEELRDHLLQTIQNGEWESEGLVHKSPALVFDTDARYVFSIKCEDFGGNTAVYEEQTPFVIDKKEPDQLTVSYDTSAICTLLENITFGFYNPLVQVTITAYDETSCVDHFTWKYTPQEDTYSLNDTAFEETIPSSNINYSEEGRKATAVIVLTADQYRQYRGRLSFTATDNAGNTSAEKHEDDVVVIDTIAPTRKVIYPIPQIIRNKTDRSIINVDEQEAANIENLDRILYYNRASDKAIAITIVITEANFDIENKRNLSVKVNGNPYHVEWVRQDEEHDPNVWTGQIVLDKDGTYDIAVTFTDHAGNEMTPYYSGEIVIDHAAPLVERYSFLPATSDGESSASDFVEMLEYGYYFKTDFAVTIHTGDAKESSGLDYVSYRLVSYQDGKQTTERTGTAIINNNEAHLTIPAGFKGQIYAKCFDFAGNESKEVTPNGMVVDKSAPEIRIVTNNNTAYRDAAGNRLFTADTSLTVTVRDTVSGIKEVGFRQNSENNTLTRTALSIPNTGVKKGQVLADGWVVSDTDQNLVTEISRTFSFTEDDNDILLLVDALDRSGNRCNEVKSETFTVDKTAPVITVDFGSDSDADVYYKENRTAVITVQERNFDAGRIQTSITNAIGNVPGVRFEQLSNREYRATVVFEQGDYTFGISGSDLGAHEAVVTYAGGNEREFVVDTTLPKTTTNFDTFEKQETQNNFLEDKTAVIEVVEHNFSADLMNLQIYRKAAGEALDRDNFTDVTAEVLNGLSWQSSGDHHKLSFTLSQDAVYLIELKPVDLAGNSEGTFSTVVFEIDKTLPIAIERNGKEIAADDTHFCDIYNSGRADDPAPTVKFKDTHLKRIEYQLYVWIPDYSTTDAYPTMVRSEKFLPGDPEHTGFLQSDEITLQEFQEDGVYELHLTAVDIAGNRSAENVNTYVRIVKNEVLAYIADSNLSKKTGLFSFQDEQNNPISMRSDKFEDLVVVVFAEADSETEVVVRDSNAGEHRVGDLSETEKSIYGIDIRRYLIPADRFSELYPDDADTTLFLTVKSGENHIDLGIIHIDNIVPSCEMPEGFHSWKWYFGDKPRTVTISNISETLDLEHSFVYDNRNEIPFEYSSEDQTISFTLEKGWHNVGIVLCDLAGNTNNIQEVTNIHVGLFWLWIILAGAVLLGIGALFIIRAKRKKAQADD